MKKHDLTIGLSGLPKPLKLPRILRDDLASALPKPLDFSGLVPHDFSHVMKLALNPIAIPRNDAIGLTSGFDRDMQGIYSALKFQTDGIVALQTSLAETLPATSAIAEMTENHRKMIERLQIGSGFHATGIGDALSSIQTMLDQTRFSGSIASQITSPLSEMMRVLQDRGVFSRLQSFQIAPSISFLSALNAPVVPDMPWYHRPGMGREEASVRPDDEEGEDQGEAAQISRQTQYVIDFIDDVIDRLMRATSAVEIGTLLGVVSLVLTFYFQYMNTIAGLETETRASERLDAFEERMDQQFDGSVAAAAERNAEFAARLEELASLAEEKAAEQRLYETTFYVVKARVTVMHCDPADADPYETWLLPGQMVELIERDGKWIRVIAYDEKTGVTHVGWVRKKYLKMHRLPEAMP